MSNEKMSEPVAWTTMPDSEDWIFLSGAKNPNGILQGVWHPLYTHPAPETVRKLVEALELSDATLKAIRWLRKPGEIKAKDALRLVETMEVLAGEPMSAIKAALDAVRSNNEEN